MPNYLARVAQAGARADSPARPAFVGPPRLPEAAVRPPDPDRTEAMFALPEELAGTETAPAFPLAANEGRPSAERRTQERGIDSESAPQPPRPAARRIARIDAAVTPSAAGEPTPQTQARPAEPTTPLPEKSARGRRPVTGKAPAVAAEKGSAVSGAAAGERASLLRAEAGRVEAGPLFEMPKTLPPHQAEPASEPGAAQETIAALPRTESVLRTRRTDGPLPDSRSAAASFGTAAAPPSSDRAFMRERAAAEAPSPEGQVAAAAPRFPPGAIPPQARPAAAPAPPDGSARRDGVGGGAVGKQTRITIGQLDVQVHNRPPNPPPSRPPTPAGPTPGDVLERRFLDRFRLRP
jgi:hypothetical protein